MSKILLRGIIPRLPVTTGPTLSLETSYRGAVSFTLSGYEAYEDVGWPGYPDLGDAPPKFYRKEVYAGRLAGSTESPEWDMHGHLYSGEKVWPALEGGEWTRFTGFYDDHSLPAEEDPRWSGTALGTPGESYSYTPAAPVNANYKITPIGAAINNSDGSTSDVTWLPDHIRYQGLSELKGVSDGMASITHGYLERKLEEEYTPCDGLAEAVANIPHDWVSTPLDTPVQTNIYWKGGADWDGTQATWRATASGLEVGNSYRISWQDQASNSHNHDFEATNTTYVYEQVVPCDEVHVIEGIQEL